MGKKRKPAEGKILNRRARFDYELSDDLVVGIQLTGAETKALRRGHGQLRGAFVTVKDNELWLLNATITGDNGIKIDDADKTRSRKILAKRREIDHLLKLKDQGRTIVPLAILTQGRFIKLRISAGKGKKNYDKRETIKRRDTDRQNS
ncbi:SsrA-binding protein SmpB, partial [Candidatus Saccharibacteria bacterium]|nr:SsrA-binding protein SmpB [Candidatus Saccharibacteria bacterium]